MTYSLVGLRLRLELMHRLIARITGRLLRLFLPDKCLSDKKRLQSEFSLVYITIIRLRNYLTVFVTWSIGGIYIIRTREAWRPGAIRDLLGCLGKIPNLGELTQGE